MARSRNQGGGSGGPPGGSAGGAGGAPVSQLAQQYAQFAASGVQAAGAVATFTSRMAEATPVGAAFQAGLQKITLGAQNLARGINAIGPNLARGLLSPVTSLASLAASVSEGTVEGQKLGMTMEFLKLTIANDFAPWVRLLTSGIQELTAGWQGLSGDTKGTIAMWLAVAAGIAAVVALLPVVGAAVGVVTAGFAALFAIVTSPWILIPTLLAALGAAFLAFFGYVVDGGKDFAETFKGNNKSWVDWLLDAIDYLGRAFARLFNWVSEQWGKAVDFLAEKIAKLGEAIGALPAGTVEQLRQMPATVGPKLDLEQWKQQMAGFRDFTKKALDFGGLFPGLGAAFGKISELMKGPAKPAFTPQLESLQGTVDRLQKELAKPKADESTDLLKSIDAAVQILKDGFAKIGGKIADAIPAVR